MKANSIGIFLEDGLILPITVGYLLDWRCYETSDVVDNSEHQLSFPTLGETSRDTCEGCLKSLIEFHTLMRRNRSGFY